MCKLGGIAARRMTGLNIRLADQVVIGAGILALLAIGGICSRRSKTDEGYFLAGRSMPSPFVQRLFPELAAAMPDHFWVSTFANLLLFGGRLRREFVDR